MKKLNQFLSLSISMFLVFSPLLQAANVQVDGSTNTTIDTARNGVSVVNIANPNSSGLSHNKYIEFNVDKQGLILNNATSTTVNTQLGGYIYGNSNLNSNAKVILNEVTSTSRSYLNGYTEVAGKRADLVIANPNGLSINGAGFINTSNVTLSTGRAILKDDKINHFDILRGDISIDGDGLDLSNVDSAYIYTHYLKLNANIVAKNLDIKLGKNQIDYASKEIISSTNSFSDKLLLDSSALGGMYAQRISLVGTDKGLGVNLPPEVLASSGDIIITNDGKISLKNINAYTNMEITSNEDVEIKNTALANDITITADTLLKDEATIYVHNDINLNLNYLENTKTLSATNNLNIDLKDYLLNDAILNAGNDLTISSNNLTNNQTLFSSNNMNLYVTDTLKNNEDANILAINNLVMSANKDNEKTNQIINNKANIKTLDGDINIYTSFLENTTDKAIKRQKYISSKNLDIDRGTTQYNLYGFFDSSYREDYGLITYSELLYDQSYYKNIFNLNMKSKTFLKKKEYSIDASQFPSRAERVRLKSTSTQEYFTSLPTKKSVLSSGGNLNIYANDAKNYLSEISASKDMILDIKNGMDNVTETLYKYNTVSGSYYYCYNDCSRFFHRADYKWAGLTTKKSSKPISYIYSTIQSGGSIDIVSGSVKNGGVKENLATTTDFSLLKEEDIIVIKTETNIAIPTNDFGLFITSKNPSSKYLIETNPEFSLYKNFISSDYMMQRIDYNPDITTKKLGDAFYESKLIQDSIFAQTGKRFLTNDIDDDQDQYKYLMDNAIQASTDLELSQGISLTKEQIDALTQDIVWMEEQIVAGEKVLVPVVYIANTDNYKIQGAKIIAAKDINIDVKNLENSGDISAGNNMSIKASDSISNIGGTIDAGLNIDMQAKNNIINTSATISATNINLTSTDGTILNQRYAKDVDYSRYGGVDKKTLVGEASNITATASLNLDAKEKVTVSGSNISAQDINIEAKNVDITTTKIKKDFYAGDSNNYIKERSTTHLSSNIDATNININTTDTTTIKGSNINANESLNIQASKIDLLAVNNTSYKESKTSSESFFKSSSTTTKKATSTNIDSKLSGSDIELITTKSDINIVGSNIDASGGIDLDSANDVNINAGYNIDHKDSKTIKTSMFSGGNLYSSTMDNIGSYDKVNIASNLNAKDITIVSKNTNIKGSNLTAQKSIDINSQNITIQTTKDESKTWEQHEEISLSFKQAASGLAKLGVEMATLSLADTGSNDVISTKALYLDTKEQTTSMINNSSNLNAGENLSLVANNGNIDTIGSNLNADGSITLNATNNINILAAYDKNNHSYKETSGYIETKITTDEGLELEIDLTMKDEKEDNSNAKASTIFSGKNLTLISKNDTNIIGSNTQAQGTTSIQTDGELKIAAAKNTSLTSVDNLNINIYVGGIPDIELGDGQLEVELGRATIDKIKKTTTNTTASKSNISSDKSIELQSKKSILVEGSDLNAKEDVTLIANKDVTIKEAKETTKLKSDELNGVATAKFVVANEYAKIPYAVKAVKEAKDGVEDAKDNYDKYKQELSSQQTKLAKLQSDYESGVGFIELEDVEEFEELVADLEDDKRYYKANIALAVVTLTTKTTALIAQTKKAATSASSSFGTGFSASLELDIEAIEKQLEQHSTASVASNIKANIINIQANNKTTIQGSNLQANNNIDITATNTDILASNDKNNKSEDTNRKYLNLSIGTSGFSMSGGIDTTTSTTDATTNINSTLQTNNININTKETTNIKGANLNAKETLTLNTKNLNTESVQNTTKSRSHSLGISAGYGGGSLSSIGANSSNANSKTKQTIQTDLTAKNVNITVQEHTKLKGATIASIDEEGRDNNNLNLTTNTLTASSLNNTNNSKSNSIGINVGVSTSQSKDTNKGIKGGTTEIDGVSTVALDFSSDRTNSKTKTLATLGSGNIQITDKENSETKMLNSDIANNTVDIYDISSHKGLKVELDVRLVNDWESIAEDLERTKRLGQSIVDVATNDAFELQDTFSHIRDVQKDLDVQKALSLKNGGKLVKILDDKNRDKYTQKERDVALNGYAQIYANVYDVNIESAKSAILKDKSGATYTNQENTSSNIFIDDIQNSGALNTANTMGHEVAHVRLNQGQTRQRETTKLQEEYSDTFGKYSADGMNFSSSTYSNVTLNANKPKTIKLKSLKDRQVVTTNTDFYLLDKAKADSGDGRMDHLSINGAQAYGTEFNNKILKTQQKVIGSVGKYTLTVHKDKNGEYIGYTAYNPETDTTITMKQEELNKFIKDEKDNPMINLMAEKVPNYEHEIINAMNRRYYSPTQTNIPNIISELPILLGAKDPQHSVVKVLTPTSDEYKENPDKYMPIQDMTSFSSLSKKDQDNLKNKNLFVSKESVKITKENATFQNGTNGLNNTKVEAIKNLIPQTFTDNQEIDFTLNYNPSRGIVADFLESSVDQWGGTTGIAKQTGEFSRDVTTARGKAGSNFANHSQANYLFSSGVKYIDAKGSYEDGGYKDKTYFLDETATKKEAREAGFPTVKSNGSPLPYEDMRYTLAETELFNFTGMTTNKTDSVAELVGGNTGRNGQISTTDRAKSILYIPKLFGNESTHTIYLCNPSLDDICGDSP